MMCFELTTSANTNKFSSKLHHTKLRPLAVGNGRIEEPEEGKGRDWDGCNVCHFVYTPKAVWASGALARSQRSLRGRLMLRQSQRMNERAAFRGNISAGAISDRARGHRARPCTCIRGCWLPHRVYHELNGLPTLPAATVGRRERTIIHFFANAATFHARLV